MAYNTGNPIGSTSPKDLSDNARNFDFLSIGPNPSYLDRLGVPRRSWSGMESEFNADQVRRESEFDADQARRVVEFKAFLESSGFETPVDYVAGLNITRPTQIVRFSGELYRAKDAALPFITMTWVADAGKFLAVGDASLRQELARPDGAGKLGYRTITVEQRLDQVLSLRAMGANGLGNTDDTELLVDAFSRTHIQIDTGGPSDVYFLRHDALLALAGENRLQVRDGVRIIGQGRVNILSNQLADGTRIELTGDRCYVGAIEIREVNATLGRYNHYGALSARGATNFAIDRTRITGSNGAAIHIRNNCQNFLIQRPYIRNSKSDGLHIQRGSRDFAIDHPDIRQVEDDCIGIVGHGKDEGYAAPSNGVIVGGYYGEQQNGAVGSGIALIGCHDIQVIQPIIRKTGLSGIRIAEEQSDGLYTPRNITIVAPDIDHTGLTTSSVSNLSKEGIFISAGYKIDIINPKIQRAGTHGIAVSGPNVDVRIYEPTITDSGSRGMWLTSSSGSGDMVTEIWGDDPRGAGASQVRNEYLRLIRPRIDRSGTDGFYLDGTSGAFVEPELTDVKVRRSNMGGTPNKYGIFLKDANGVCYSGLDAGSSGSGTALLASLQFAGANTTGTTGFIDNIQTRLASLTIPLQSKYGIREFWNTTFPTAATGVEGGYKVAETIRNPNPSNGIVRWVCTVAGDPGTWVAK
ncbi:MAG: hypothetical protein ACRES5_04025 [Pseudomonas sp.]